MKKIVLITLIITASLTYYQYCNTNCPSSGNYMGDCYFPQGCPNGTQMCNKGKKFWNGNKCYNVLDYKQNICCLGDKTNDNQATCK